MARAIFNEERCKGCGLGVDACPKGIVAISKDRMNSKGYRPAELTDPSQCIGCAFCARMCPDVCIEVEK